MGIFLIALFCAILAVSMFYASHGRLGFWPLVFGGFGGTVIGVILSLFITIGEAPRKFIKDSCTWYTTEKNIISLKGKTEISGGFFLGTGSINSRLHYYTYVETEDGKTIFITSSIGVTDYNPHLSKGADIYKMIKASRKALDMAKVKGGNEIKYLELENSL